MPLECILKMFLSVYSIRVYVCARVCVCGKDSLEVDLKFLKGKESTMMNSKRNLRKSNVSVLHNALNSWKCEACDRMLLSKAATLSTTKHML